MPCSETVILTVYNRPELVLLNTMVSLRRNDLTDTEILVVDDGSTIDYTDLRETLEEMKLPIRWERVSTLEDRPDTYNINGHNNPAYVNNRAVEMAEGKSIYFLSSDTLIPPNTLASARLWDLDKTIYVTRVIDMDSGQEYNGTSRPYPMCWFMGVSKDLVQRIGGFDEEYLKGMAYEDSDFAGRAILDTRKLVIDTGTLALHQSHENIAYSDELKGVKTSLAYTRKKWGGVPPWDSAGPPLNYTLSVAGDKIIAKPRPTEEMVARFKVAA